MNEIPFTKLIFSTDKYIIQLKKIHFTQFALKPSERGNNYSFVINEL